MRHFLSQSALVTQSLFDVFVSEALDVNALHTTADGFQQSVGLLADHDEYRLRRGLFQ